MINPARAAAPGKLFIAGEYAVVTPGEPAILVALDRLLTVDLTPRTGPGVTITSSAYAAPVEWKIGDPATDYVTSALAAAEAVRASRGIAGAGYTLSITSDLDDGDRKLGLGSSAAVTVATVEAVSRAYDLGLSAMERFRLALIASIVISPRGSGGDIAASTFGGWIQYTSPQRDAIADAVAARGVGAALTEESLWAGCDISPLPAPPVKLLVGWTGEPASTDTLVARARGDLPDEDFHTESRRAVNNVARALEHGETAALIEAIHDARGVLTRFAAARGTVIETETLAVLAQTAEKYGGAGKPSGAGGGDCGIAFAPDTEAAGRILEQWARSGITPLDLATYDREGDTP